MRKDTKQVTLKEARKTALVVAAVLVLLTAIFAYRGRTINAVIAASIAMLLAAIGLFAPPLAIFFHRAWMWIARKLGWVNSRILLTLVYFLVFVPYKMVSRVLGRDPLRLRQPAGDTYWHKREKTSQSPEQFERLF